jgi:hypothetical protein
MINLATQFVVHIVLHDRHHNHPGGARGVLLNVVGDVHMYPETLQPWSGISLILTFFAPPLLSLRHVEPVVKF